MNKSEIIKLAEQHEARAQSAFEKYQETGTRRYYNERCRNEDIAKLMRRYPDGFDAERSIHRDKK